jgi:2-polyprenyl-3-methyl-5-hydroxy-6-metoxy-1,4-benzoquinol methylase
VVLEGMAAGLPVVAANAGGPSELITDGVDGVLVAPGDPQALASTLRRLHDDQALRERLGAAARVRASEFTPQRAALQLVENYRSVLDRGGRSWETRRGSHGYNSNGSLSCATHLLHVAPGPHRERLEEHLHRLDVLAFRALTDLGKAYDRWHSDHGSGAGPWYELLHVPLLRHLKEATVLEIGCGAGGFADWMAAQGAESVVGQDLSPLVIGRATEQFSRTNLAFSVGDIQDIKFDDDRFDVVVSCETIEHVPAPAEAVRELARVLRPGGSLLLTTPNYMSLSGLHRLYSRARGRDWTEGGQPLVNWTLLPRTLVWLRRAGLSPQCIDGSGWYVPVPRRAGGYSWQPGPRLRRAVIPFGLHQLIEARKS